MLFEEHKNIPILFIGTGLSLRYLKSSYTWSDLLSDISKVISTERFYQDGLSNKIKKENPNIDDFDLNVKLASLMKSDFDERFFAGNLIISEEIYNYIASEYESNRKVSPFNIYISYLFSEIDFKDEMKDEIRELKKLKENNLLTIVTTNYDNMISEIFKNFDVSIGDSMILEEPENSIFHIHGHVRKPDTLIFTEEDYLNFEVKQKILHAKLLSYFVERPIIFLGYSLTDKNIKKIISDILISLDLNSKLYEKIKNNFILIEYDENNSELEFGEYSFEMSGKTFNIAKIKTDNYIELYRKISKIKVKTPVKEIKKFKSMIKTLVAENAKVEFVSKVSEEDLDKINERNEVVSIGLTAKYKPFDFSLKKMLAYVLVDESDQDISSLEIFKNYYTSKKYYNTNHRYPIYKILSDIKVNQKEEFNKIMDDENYLNIIKKYQKKYDKIIRQVDKHEIRDNFNSKKENHLNELKKFKENLVDEKTFKEYIKKEEIFYNENYKESVLLYDYLKYKHKI